MTKFARNDRRLAPLAGEHLPPGRPTKSVQFCTNYVCMERRVALRGVCGKRDNGTKVGSRSLGREKQSRVLR
jgi:hypothetical protein